MPPGTVRQAIDWYLGSVQLAESSRACYRHALASEFAPVLDERLRVLTAQRAAALRHNLKSQVRKRTAAPFSRSTIVVFWSVARKFSRWVARLGWIPTDPLAATHRGIPARGAL